MLKSDGYGIRPIDHLDKLQKPARSIRHGRDKTSPNEKGCPANDGNEHVYAHVLYTYSATPRREAHETRVLGDCIGCGHRRRSHKRSKPTGDPDVIIRYIWREDIKGWIIWR